jgi:plastocyanin
MFDRHFITWGKGLLFSICVIMVGSVTLGGVIFFYVETYGTSETDPGRSAREVPPGDGEELEPPSEEGPSETEDEEDESESGPSSTEAEDEDSDSDSEPSSMRFISISPNPQGNLPPAIFSPDYLTVEQGTTVTWTNNDFNAHELTSSLPASTDFPVSQYVNPSGGSFAYQFDTAGTFEYYCTIHPQMTGTIVIR